MKKLQNDIIIILCLQWGEMTMMKSFQFFYSILCEEQLKFKRCVP